MSISSESMSPTCSLPYTSPACGRGGKGEDQQRDPRLGCLPSLAGDQTDIVDEDVDVLELLGDAVQEALDGGTVLHVELEALDAPSLAGRALLVRLEGGLFHFFELGLTAGGEDEGGAGAGESNGL